MADTLSADEAKKRYVALMGDELGTLFSALWQEVAWLNHKWLDYVALFGTKQSRIDLMNQAAPAFFHMLNGTLWDDTLLHIARLTDPPDSGRGRTNLTIRRLAPLVTDATAREQVAELTDTAVEAAAFCRDWRNRRIAHRDLEHALDGSARPLKEGSRLKVKAALDGIGGALNAVSRHYQDSTTLFDLGAAPGGAESLLHVIDSGLKRESERMEAFKRGEIPPSEAFHDDV